MLALLVSLFLVGADPVSSVDSDEFVVFFPTAAHFTDGAWNIPVLGWIYEKRTFSSFAINNIAKLLFEEKQAGEVFKRRAAWFATDNERGERIVVRIDGKVYQLPKLSAKSGHFQSMLRVRGSRS